ncbi:MAG: Phosphoglycolate phosphatase [Acidobacteria bacterium ADurb.Bin051]|jgi:phosphoglycolate phosphatase-like HAD superfamily hydrolase|nr:MAG: Phosphoglycolate phosphatase [Acidobacteria bacterium ADurb.Bin051]
MSPRRLVLFDIDGTLLLCGGQAKPLFAAAMEAAFGTAGAIDSYDFSGRTDPQIVVDLALGAGIEPEAAMAGVPRVRDHYLARLAGALRAEEMRLMPGVGELVAALAASGEVALGLLTGNWERGARIKLAPFDLNRYFPFGAFGDDQLHRRGLPPVAWREAARHTARDFAPEETLIVGDSLLDIDCAHAHGARVLAVATGWTSAAALRAAGADWVVDDLAGARDLAAATGGAF